MFIIEIYSSYSFFHSISVNESINFLFSLIFPTILSKISLSIFKYCKSKSLINIGISQNDLSFTNSIVFGNGFPIISSILSSDVSTTPLTCRFTLLTCCIFIGLFTVLISDLLTLSTTYDDPSLFIAASPPFIKYKCCYIYLIDIKLLSTTHFTNLILLINLPPS